MKPAPDRIRFEHNSDADLVLVRVAHGCRVTVEDIETGEVQDFLLESGSSVEIAAEAGR